MKKSVPKTTSLEIYRQMLLAKRDDVLSGLGIRFDTRARLGRVAEDDQAQITHEEFIFPAHQQPRLPAAPHDRRSSPPSRFG